MKRAELAVIQASHLVEKMIRLGKHEQDRKDAEEWVSNYKELTKKLREKRRQD